MATQSVQNHQNRFPLLGAHAAVVCDACHRGAAVGTYTGLSTQCFSCHQQDYLRSSTVDHRAAGFPTTCETCHNVETWQAARFDHNRFTRFQLTGAHRNLVCASCHVGGRFQSTPADCFGCHANDFARTTTPNHVAAGFPRECSSCHTTASWLGAQFDHAKSTSFALTGAHMSLSCVSCHVGGRFAGTPQACSGCHVPDFERATNPDHRRSNFPTTCETCHTTQAWQGATFNHNQSRFPLTGKHTTVACSQCHANNQFTGTPTACVDCHRAAFNATTSPAHAAAGFPTECTLCHTTLQWQGAKFDHNSATKFPLTGKHTTVSCISCHVGNRFAGTPQTCVDCHLADYQKTANPNHQAASFPTICALCHTTAQWAGAKFDHNTSTKFPLTGKHAQVSCQQCHANGQYATLPTNCVTCHLKEYEGTTNPNHAAAGFPQDCSLCHNSIQWPGAKFDHNTATKFPLTGKHTTTTCAQCHVNGQFAGLGTQCSTCHLKDFQGTKSPNHVAAAFPTDCALCHTTIQWQGAQFDHNKTKFPLTGKHTSAICAQCHANGQYAALPTTCVTCHLKEYQGTSNPNHIAAGFPQDCSLCHTTTQWPGAKFDHNTSTKFPLTGKHATTTCAQCHANGQYATLPTTCVTCHLKEYQSTSSPNHTAAGFPQDCSLCHTTTQWPGAKFDHNTSTKFPLTGKHATTTCAQCHANGRYATLPTTCVTCHLKEYQGTSSPNHTAAGFPQDCSLCHTTTQWPGAKFDHSKTKFPLTGKHTTTGCAQCHASGQYATLPTTCVTCHLKEYQGTTNPNHAAAAFPQDCSLCHTTTQWPGAKFDHSKTRFPLTGKHATTSCAQCHASGQYATLPTTCVTCHLKEFQGTTNPNHAAAGFPQDCSVCHSTTQWPGAKFDHNTATKFPLTGKHTAVACAACHVSNQYATLPTTCVSCHLAKYQAATNPNHVAAGFPQDCQLCHTTAQWPGATFNHSTTRFPLTGKHTTLTCAQCHANGQFATLPTTCVSCHLAKYQATTNPNHAAAGFPQDCSLCHTTTQWPGATFNHGATRFPLTGKHTTVACLTCHANNQYATLPTPCVSCHLGKYQATTNPNHVAAGFPQDCSLCHSTTQWPGATFNHSTTAFPLTGKHTTTQCAQCHVNNVYRGTPKDCYSCHTREYNGTTNPNHVAAGFPTTCNACHTTTQWPGATFNHTRFPITSGNHKQPCATCHTNSNNYTVFTCTSSGCHTQTTTDNHHQGVRNYIYNSINCYSCHPNGRAG